MVSSLTMNPNLLGLGAGTSTLPGVASTSANTLFNALGSGGNGGSTTSFGLPGLGSPGGAATPANSQGGTPGISSDITSLMSMLSMMLAPLSAMINQLLAGIASGSISSKAPEGAASGSPATATSASASTGSGGSGSSSGTGSTSSTTRGEAGTPNDKGFISPLKKGSYTLGDGLGAGRNHGGQDMAAPQGTDIMAAKEGKIVELKNDPAGYGQYITIEHADGTKTRYAHMSAFGKFKVGDTVQQGDIIGKVGSTGRSTGPHLHFEVIAKDGSKLEPKNYAPLA
ncbi:MAG: M23 family metallopeptidase [Candidatus Melainabacteria bacterium]